MANPMRKIQTVATSMIETVQCGKEVEIQKLWINRSLICEINWNTYSHDKYHTTSSSSPQKYSIGFEPPWRCVFFILFVSLSALLVVCCVYPSPLVMFFFLPLSSSSFLLLLTRLRPFYLVFMLSQNKFQYKMQLIQYPYSWRIIKTRRYTAFGVTCRPY